RQPDVRLDVPRRRRLRPRLHHRHLHHDRGRADHGVERQAGCQGRGDPLMTAADTPVATPAVAAARPTRLARVNFGRLVAHLALLALVVIWTMPTAGLLISSLRDKEQLTVSGWWTSLTTTDRNEAATLPPATAQVEEDGRFVIRGDLIPEGRNDTIRRF